ncbi:hypothetical protein VTN77DRAFT_2947 [Rasamsonia byssochlamydoides]|uniref:uncharacterized protein n=1 Tax=Rasamsonia byssochlamydoides TaxID=89139 RepID=UPI003743E7CD
MGVATALPLSLSATPTVVRDCRHLRPSLPPSPSTSPPSPLVLESTSPSRVVDQLPPASSCLRKRRLPTAPRILTTYHRWRRKILGRVLLKASPPTLLSPSRCTTVHPSPETVLSFPFGPISTRLPTCHPAPASGIRSTTSHAPLSSPLVHRSFRTKISPSRGPVVTRTLC